MKSTSLEQLSSFQMADLKWICRSKTELLLTSISMTSRCFIRLEKCLFFGNDELKNDYCAFIKAFVYLYSLDKLKIDSPQVLARKHVFFKTDLEQRKTAVFHFLKNPIFESIFDFERFSSFSQTERIFPYVYQFIDNRCWKKKNFQFRFIQADLDCTNFAPNQEFAPAISTPWNGKPLSSKSTLLKFAEFLNNESLVVVDCRLNNSELPDVTENHFDIRLSTFIFTCGTCSSSNFSCVQ